jgi:hypothetical protein
MSRGLCRRDKLLRARDMGKMPPGLGPLAIDFRGGFLLATKAEEPVGSGLWHGRTDWPTRVGSST